MITGFLFLAAGVLCLGLSIMSYVVGTVVIGWVYGRERHVE